MKRSDKKRAVVSSNIAQLISLPEGQYFDRKSARIHLNDLARHICAFANASGGTIAVGIEDDGKVSGFKFDGSQDIEEIQRCYIF
ncbi:ATP-binding protein [Bifidobacterium sp. ESL0690]|uniref:AlbA family DNA-binding domain-containing protein n=1 Tax=Bifidobacterium sp. ESL0690 TaxID=2983214 RepID=UPI0023F74A84|nr:ATP-binding protein [Bifidobacterium sp. ESL0690]WEV46745.1 ATP-binding protein [Bifidobacterium sp. ESL0690]